MEKPKEGLKKSSKAAKKQKVDGEEKPAGKKDDAELTEAELAKRAEYVQKRKEKRQKKSEQQRKQKERAKEKKKSKAKGIQPEVATGGANSTTNKPTKQQEKKSNDVRSEQKPKKQHIKDQPLTSTRQEEQSDVDEDDENDDDDDDDEEEDDDVAGGERDADLAKIDFSGLVDEASDEDMEDDDHEEEQDEDEENMQPITIDGMDVDDSDAVSADGSETTPDHSPTFDGESSSSSTSSIVPPSQGSTSTTTKPLKVATQEPTTAITTTTTTTATARPTKLPSPIDPALLQSRLQARIAALRAARKADGLNGNPARNRQELLEARRLKAETRKATKKELRAKTRLAQDAEAEAARLRGGSGSPLWSPAIMSPRVEEENSFSFGRIAFDDGARVDDKLGGLVDSKARRGTSDVKTRLDAVTRKKERLSGMNAEKRKEIEEKDRWLTARKKVQGEKVRDDANLLKKTLKRKEKLKDKSGKEWDGRIEGVRAGKEMRQKKRDENLRKRKEDKGSKGKKSGSKGGSKGGKKPAPKKRAGFEGTAKSGAKRS